MRIKEVLCFLFGKNAGFIQASLIVLVSYLANNKACVFRRGLATLFLRRIKKSDKPDANLNALFAAGQVHEKSKSGGISSAFAFIAFLNFQQLFQSCLHFYMPCKDLLKGVLKWGI